MSKPQPTKPDSVTQATFDLAIAVRNWLSEYGQGAEMQVDPDNDEQMWVLPEFNMHDMQSAGIDTFTMPERDGAWCDWYSSAIIVVGPNQTPTAQSQSSRSSPSVLAGPDR